MNRAREEPLAEPLVPHVSEAAAPASGIKGRRRCAHTKLLLLIQNCMLQRLYSINIYSLQKNMVLEPFKITGKKQTNKKIRA